MFVASAVTAAGKAAAVAGRSSRVAPCCCIADASHRLVQVGPLHLGGRELSEREKFLLLSGSSLVVIFFLTSVGSVLFYALGLSMLLIGVHAALRVPDDLFLDEGPEAQSGGFLSLLTGGGQPRVPVAAAV